MIPGMPTLGIRFDIDKIESGTYGFICWKVFWSVVDINKIGSVLLFEGDTAATPDSENVFCIAVQSGDAAVLRTIRDALDGNDEFKELAASPEFLEDEAIIEEPLPDAGRVDAAGKITGGYWASAALDAVRKQG